MIGVGKMKQYTNVLDNPVSKGKQERVWYPNDGSYGAAAAREIMVRIILMPKAVEGIQMNLTNNKKIEGMKVRGHESPPLKCDSRVLGFCVLSSIEAASEFSYENRRYDSHLESEEGCSSFFLHLYVFCIRKMISVHLAEFPMVAMVVVVAMVGISATTRYAALGTPTLYDGPGSPYGREPMRGIGRKIFVGRLS